MSHLPLLMLLDLQSLQQEEDSSDSLVANFGAVCAIQIPGKWKPWQLTALNSCWKKRENSGGGSHGQCTWSAELEGWQIAVFQGAWGTIAEERWREDRKSRRMLRKDGGERCRGENSHAYLLLWLRFSSNTSGLADKDLMHQHPSTPPKDVLLLLECIRLVLQYGARPMQRKSNTGLIRHILSLSCTTAVFFQGEGLGLVQCPTWPSWTKHCKDLNLDMASSYIASSSRSISSLLTFQTITHRNRTARGCRTWSHQTALNVQKKPGGPSWKSPTIL